MKILLKIIFTVITFGVLVHFGVIEFLLAMIAIVLLGVAGGLGL